MKEFFTVVGILNCIILVLLVIFYLTKVSYFKKMMELLTKSLIKQAKLNPYDGVACCRNIANKLNIKLDDDAIKDKSPIEYIVNIYNKNIKTRKEVFKITLTDRDAINQIGKIINSIILVSNDDFDVDFKEKATVPSYISLKNENLRNIDPYDPDITEEQKIEIMKELKDNFLYFATMMYKLPYNTLLALRQYENMKKDNSQVSNITHHDDAHVDVSIPLDDVKDLTIGEIEEKVKSERKKKSK